MFSNHSYFVFANLPSITTMAPKMYSDRAYMMKEEDPSLACRLLKFEIIGGLRCAVEAKEPAKFWRRGSAKRFVQDDKVDDYGSGQQVDCYADDPQDDCGAGEE